MTLLGFCSLHIVYVFKLAWRHLAKFWQSDQRFSRHIFEPLCLKFETSVHAQLVNTYYLQISWHSIRWKLTSIPLNKWGLLMISWMWSHDLEILEILSGKQLLTWNFDSPFNLRLHETYKKFSTNFAKLR